MARIELSNIGGGGGTTLSLTTTGTSGASTLAGSVLNIPVYQGQLTLTTTGTSGAATLAGDILNIPNYATGGSPAGSTGEIQYNNAGAFAASSNLAWDNAAVQLNIGAPSSPTGKLNVKGGGATSSTVNFKLTNSGNTELLKVLDNGSANIGNNFVWDEPNANLTIGQSSGSGATLNVFKLAIGSPPIQTRIALFNGYRAPNQGEATIEVGQNHPDGSTTRSLTVIGGSNLTGTLGGFIETKNPTTRAISFNALGAVKICGSQIGSFDYTGLSIGASTNIGTNVPTTEGVVFRTISGAMTSIGGNANNFNQSSFGQITVNKQVLTTTYTDASNVYIVGPPIQGTATLTNRFSLFVASGNSYFAENIGVGVKIASARLHIQGSNTSSGTNALLVQNSSPDDLYKIENNGKISYWATNTAAGTTGAQTIDRPSGTVNFGIGDSALVVTNSLCTTSSIVFATVRTNDATAQIKNVVPAAGSFTINLSAAATAETSVGFFIIN